MGRGHAAESYRRCDPGRPVPHQRGLSRRSTERGQHSNCGMAELLRNRRHDLYRSSHPDSGANIDSLVDPVFFDFSTEFNDLDNHVHFDVIDEHHIPLDDDDIFLIY